MDQDIWLEIGWDKNQQRIDSLYRDLGVRRAEANPWVTLITPDAVRHFVEGVGDNNPLWSDRPGNGDIEARTLVPPALLFAASPTLNATRCPVADGWAWGGVSLKWYEPLKLGRSIAANTRVETIHEESRTQGGKSYAIVHRIEFHDLDGTLVAEAEARETSCIIGGPRKVSAPPAPLAPYDLDDIVDVYSVYAAETPRTRTLFFDEVAVGQKLPTLAKGPITPSGTIAYLQGIGGMAVANRLAWQTAQRRPYDAPDNGFGVPDLQDRVHWDGAFARTRGLPGASPPASARACWMIHQITDWMGDLAMLHAADCTIVAPDPEGDALFFHAEVVDCFVDRGLGLVRIDQRAERRDRSVSASGTVLVELPVRV